MNDQDRLIWGRYLSVVATSRRMELEALDELVNEIGKPILEETKAVEKPTETQFNGLGWTLKKGARGDYEQSENDNSEAFKILSQYVKAHGGFSNLFGWKLWLHNSNENLIDRKR